jgi:hypothetical protein
MSLYNLALFFHILGALGIFTALGLEWMSLINLQRVTTAEQAREWLTVFPWLRQIGPASLGILFLAGLYMTLSVWKWVAWINIALLAMLLLPVLGASNGLRMAAIGETLASEKGPLSPSLIQQLRAPRFWISIRLRTAVLLGIIFLMTIKPGLMGSLLTIGVALLLGFVLNRFPQKESPQLAEDVVGN